MRISVIIIGILLSLLTACKSEESAVVEENAQEQSDTNKVDDGPFLQYHKSGEIQIVGEYKNGKRVGLWSSWYPSGELQSEITYKEGLEDGDYQVFHESGNQKIKGFYSNGKAVGEWVFFDSEGKENARKNYDA